MIIPRAGSMGTQEVNSHLPGRFDRTMLSTGPTFPEDWVVNRLASR